MRKTMFCPFFKLIRRVLCLQLEIRLPPAFMPRSDGRRAFALSVDGPIVNILLLKLSIYKEIDYHIWINLIQRIPGRNTTCGCHEAVIIFKYSLFAGITGLPPSGQTRRLRVNQVASGRCQPSNKRSIVPCSYVELVGHSSFVIFSVRVVKPLIPGIP
jgi:hypothetical protein